MSKKENKHRYPLAVRVACIVLAVLVTGSVLTFLGLFISGLIH